MPEEIVSLDFYYVTSRDRIGGTVKTEVFRKNSGIYQAYSSYAQDLDEEVIGYWESEDYKEAVKRSRTDLREKWKENMKK